MDKKFYRQNIEKKPIIIKKNEKPEYKGMKKRYLKKGQSCKVTFMLPKEAANKAKKVHVLGEFNKWDTNATPLKRLKAGNFSTTLELACGRSYRFKYLIDDARWENDWHADSYIPNQYGGEDSLVSV